MGFVLYVLAVVLVVLLAGWAVYVLPTPGDLPGWQTLGAIVPALGLFIGVVVLAVAFRLLWLVIEWVVRAVRRSAQSRHRRPRD